jgi:hypothetical protein
MIHQNVKREDTKLGNFCHTLYIHVITHSRGEYRYISRNRVCRKQSYDVKLLKTHVSVRTKVCVLGM